MNRHIRHGAFSVAVAALLLAVVVLSSRSGTAGDGLDLAAHGAGGPDQPSANSTAINAVVCDEGLPPEICVVSVPVFLDRPMPLEATTYDGHAVAGEDYLPLAHVPVEVPEGAQYVEVRVELVDNRECEPQEDLVLVVTGPELEVVSPVIIVDDDC